MERLTEKTNCGNSWCEDGIETDNYIPKNQFDSTTGKCIEKLGKLEDLGEELGCPLDVVGRLILHKERYIYTIEKSKLTGEYFMDKHTIVGVSEFGVCILTTNWILKTEPKYYKWNEYKKSFWLKEDRSE